MPGTTTCPQPTRCIPLLAKSTIQEFPVNGYVHPGGPRILDACGHTLGLREKQLAVSREVLSEFGNRSSPTVLFILDRLRQRHAMRPCVILAFGPGLTIEAALLR
ncbi:MAG TPA: 3-oxoacyl-[acyl-carrier-protein] synthase III C-terminal domain-containing protein [Pirellulales bacterium]